MIEAFLTQYSYSPCFWFRTRRQRHFAMTEARIVVLHCGSTAPDLDRYLSNPLTDETDKLGFKCPDGEYRRQVSAHFGWSPTANDFVQKLPLNRRGWHVGDVMWRDCHVQNFSIGIEGPGPYNRNRHGDEMDAWIRLLVALKLNAPELEVIVGHQTLTASKKDPGPKFEWGRVVEEVGPMGVEIVVP